MSSIKEEVQLLYRRADQGETLAGLIDQICRVFREHPQELKGFTNSYRLCATDTGYVKAFSLVDGQYFDKTEMDEADVILSGRESDLLAILRRRISPLSALLRGKVQLRGSKTALLRFTEFL